MKRVLFGKGKQRMFLDLVIERLNSPSLRGLLQFGFNVSYSSLRNYYIEDRLMPEGLVDDMCELAGISKDGLNVGYLKENWGQKLGGSVSKRGRSRSI